MKTSYLRPALALLSAALVACNTDYRISLPVDPPETPPDRVAQLAAYLDRHDDALPGTIAVHIDEAEDSRDLGRTYIDSASFIQTGTLWAERGSHRDGWASFRARFAMGDSGSQFIAGFMEDAADTSSLKLHFNYLARLDEAESINAILRITRHDRATRTISGKFAARMGTLVQGFLGKYYWSNVITVSGTFTDISTRK